MTRPDQGRTEPVAVAFCWTVLSGYMAACWRSLAALPGVRLSVVAFTPSSADDTGFDPELLRGLDSLLLSPERREDYGTVKAWLAERQPGFLAVGGWGRRLNRRLLVDPAFGSTRKLLFMDNVLRGDLRQWLGRFVLRRYLQRIDSVFVPGERSAAFARFLGVPLAKVRRGAYGIDSAALEPQLAARLRLPGGWPRRFLFAGRYVHSKGVETLVEAYRSYRRMVAEPWELVCCGAGPLRGLLVGQAGVTDAGFLQPQAVYEQLRRAGAFVLASRQESWGVALAEAAAAGLPVICSDACGASTELLRDFWNGVRVPAGDVARLAEALRWMHDRLDRAALMGRRSQALAAPYAATEWADRVLAAVRG